MPINLLNYIIFIFSKKYKIEIILDDSLISQFIFDKIDKKKCINIIYPKDLKTLFLIIDKTDFGIFMDSGPLHFAKINNIKGILILSSVSKDILLDGFESIISIIGNYKSQYCNGPCGLTNAFFYNNKSGCFDSLNIKKNTVMEYNNLKELQRGSLKQNYNDLLTTNVNCLKYINKIKVVKLIRDNIEMQV